jgi:hypothetical protein
MLNLDNYVSKIENFIQDSINKFQREYKSPTSVGIYCCPWAGWLTVNFNVIRTISDTQNNCPDFEFVEYASLDLEDWQNEYEKEHPEFKINQIIKKHNHDFGDEKFNELIFEFLKPIAGKLSVKSNSIFLIQMLDSRYVEKIRRKS